MHESKSGKLSISIVHSKTFPYTQIVITDIQKCGIALPVDHGTLSELTVTDQQPTELGRKKRGRESSEFASHRVRLPKGSSTVAWGAASSRLLLHSKHSTQSWNKYYDQNDHADHDHDFLLQDKEREKKVSNREEGKRVEK